MFRRRPGLFKLRNLVKMILLNYGHLFILAFFTLWNILKRDKLLHFGFVQSQLGTDLYIGFS